MNRREFSVAFGALALGAAAGPGSGLAQDNKKTPFSRKTVVDMAREMAKTPYDPPQPVPDTFTNLSYDDHRKIRFKKDRALWAGKNRGFAVELLHAGFVVKSPVEIFKVEDGKAEQITYSPDYFDFGDLSVKPPEGQPLFSGIRINAPINVLHHYDEVVVFQGASYFRGVGADQLYGISARGLAIDTGEPTGEEFPFFRSFWIERPAVDSKTITVHALLDSRSVTGAFTFVIRPGASTVLDVEAALFGRADVNHLGLAPLTSMYLFDARERDRFDDFRPAVHDSDTLSIARNNGEWIMRPLANPEKLQISAFVEEDPLGFGLQQREREYEDYKDLEARYELRPSAWVEPKTPWKQGHVQLVEIPTDLETNDNIVAFWHPRKRLKRGQEMSYGYWLTFGPPIINQRIARVAESRMGMSVLRKRRQFIVDFDPPIENGVPVYLGSDVEPQVTASSGRIEHVVGRHNPMTGGYQVSFEMDTTDVELSELRLVLAHDGEQISETWLYRWTA
ncbi:glucan biosynthesis protein [Methyloligella solikamskensis]|uniref:Glucan biosynthesis protein n=1 Tax=Methyloligella solikamskensis TaxID=1177756 RepID=A0ABW3JA91_9HYPH